MLTDSLLGSILNTWQMLYAVPRAKGRGLPKYINSGGYYYD